MKLQIILAAAAAVSAAGCIQVKTESEIKPIHITMDVNLNMKVDKALDEAFADENNTRPKGDFKAVKEMMDRQAAGFTNRAMLQARESATENDHLLIAEENAIRMKRFSAIAKDNGTTLEEVQKRYAARMRGKVASGTWYQDDAGAWRQKE